MNVFNPFKGLATVVPLDYGSRYEYSVLVVPRDWDTLYSMMVSPEEMLDSVRSHFATGIVDSQQNQVSAISKSSWKFKSPMEICINPLTLQTGKVKGLIRALQQYYPGGHHCGEDIPSFEEIATNLHTYSPVDFANALTASAAAPIKGGFPLQYIAEFALFTGVLNIFYLPRTSGVFAPSQNKFCSWVTQATISPIHGPVPNTKLVHFDFDFNDCSHSHRDVAERRAALVFDFINDQATLLHHLDSHRNLDANKKKPDGSAKPTNKVTTALTGNGLFVDESRSALVIEDRTPSNFLQVTPITAPPHQTAIIERVLPNLKAVEDKISGASQMVVPSTMSAEDEDPPKPPYPCVVAEWVDGKWVWVQVKSYSFEENPNPNVSTFPTKGNSGQSKNKKQRKLKAPK